MIPTNISDSFAGIGVAPAACPRCGAKLSVNGSDCLRCLLETGLEQEPAEEEGEGTLEELLAEIDVRDTDWRLGNYQIIEEIGRGGMGVIYRARQRHSKRVVALKRVLSYHGDSRETLERFRREAEAAASLDHPNILPIYEVGEADGLPFFTMKLATGGSLQRAAPSLGAEPRECVRLLAKVARAVAYAHREGILHRDLKPGNILLDGRGEPMVSDFGLAKWIDTNSDLTRSLAIFGTPGFIAPEQARGPAAALTPASDIYSLGAILFDLLSGRPPFLGQHAIAVIHQAGEKTAPKLRSIVRNADRDLETICAKCLEREPSARYRSAADLAEDLERWLEGRPIVARPVSPPAKVFRWSKRNPALAATIGACVVFGGLVGTERSAKTRLSTTIQQVEAARRSVTVLPFIDLTELSPDTSAAHAFSKTLAATLGSAAGLQLKPLVRPPGVSPDPWRREDWQVIGEATGARLVLDGTIRERDGKCRVTSHLIEASSGSVVTSWIEESVSLPEIAATLRRHISDYLHDDNIRAAGKAGSPSLTASRQRGESTNREAISYYDRGKEFFFRYNLADQERAIDSFQKAVELDPEYGQAQAMLGWACQLRAMSGDQEQWLARAEAATKAALRLAPMLSDSHRAAAGLLQRRGYLRESLDPYLTAYELEPTNARAAATVGNLYDELGRPDLALRWLHRATARDTRPVYADNIGNALTALGQYAEAERAYRTAAIFRPDLPVGALGLSRLELLRGNYDAARRECASARARHPRDPHPLIISAMIDFYARDFPAAEQSYLQAMAADANGGVDFPGSIRFLSAIGYIKLLSPGRAEQGRALLREALALDEKELATNPRSPTRLYSLAATQASLGNTEAAMLALENAVVEGWIDHQSLRLDPRFDAIRSLPQFADTLTRLAGKLQAMRSPLLSAELASTTTQKPQKE